MTFKEQTMRRLLLVLFLLIPPILRSQTPVMKWDFEKIQNRNAIEISTNISDTIEVNFEVAAGVKSNGLRPDGF